MKSAKFLHVDNEDSDPTAGEVQADLSLRWAHMSEGTFSYVVAHLF